MAELAAIRAGISSPRLSRNYRKDEKKKKKHVSSSFPGKHLNQAIIIDKHSSFRNGILSVSGFCGHAHLEVSKNISDQRLIVYCPLNY